MCACVLNICKCMCVSTLMHVCACVHAHMCVCMQHTCTCICTCVCALCTHTCTYKYTVTGSVMLSPLPSLRGEQWQSLVSDHCQHQHQGGEREVEYSSLYALDCCIINYAVQYTHSLEIRGLIIWRFGDRLILQSPKKKVRQHFAFLRHVHVCMTRGFVTKLKCV